MTAFPWRNWAGCMVCCLLLAMAHTGRGQPAAPSQPDAALQPLRFMRVIVPPGRLADIEPTDALSGSATGGGRHVPMSIGEFEAAISRLAVSGEEGAGGSGIVPFPPVADEARYEVVVGRQGGTSGSLSFTIGAGHESLPKSLPLGQLNASRATARTAAGTGEALLFGGRGGGTFMATPAAGTYACEWMIPAVSASAGSLCVLPLVPGLHTEIIIWAPRGLRPLVAGGAAVRQPEALEGPLPEAETASSLALQAWRIEVGPLPALHFTLVPLAIGTPRLATWRALEIRGREVATTMTVQPVEPWTGRTLVLEKDPGVSLLEIRASGVAQTGSLVWQELPGGRNLEIVLAESCIGTTTPLVLSAVAPFPSGVLAAVPVLRVPAGLWAAGGSILEVDPAQMLSEMEVEECLIVAPAVAARWPGKPAPEAQISAEGPPPGAAQQLVPPARVAVEEQGAAAVLRVAIEPRRPEVDVARVTTVEVASSGLLGRAACDVSVRRGAAFSIGGRIGQDWFIDSVEAVDGAAGRERLAVKGSAGISQPLEWKVVRDPQGDMLSIGFTRAVLPLASLGLRITGHRSGVATGVSFDCAELEMVRLEGEADERVLIACKTSPETTVVLEGEVSPPDLTVPRLARLMEEGAVRVWIPGGGRGEGLRGRLLRQRPPLVARTQVRLTARDERLTEAFTFECRPETSDLDALVVHFSEPMNDLLEWSLLPPAKAALAVRRADHSDEATERSATEPGESWMIEFTPPVREPVKVRAVRTLPFTEGLPIPLAWVEGTLRQDGEVSVLSAGRRRPRIVNHQLAEMPPGPADANAGPGEQTLAEFLIPPAGPIAIGASPAAEILPGSRDRDEDARAWVWAEETTCWCHPSGMTECETLFEIENHGRSSVAVSPPAGQRLIGILLDGVRVTAGDNEALAGRDGPLLVPLPSERRFVRLLIRSVADREPLYALWPVSLSGGAIDVPVLEKRWSLRLARDVALAWIPSGVAPVGGTSPDWLERLSGARRRPPTTVEEPPNRGLAPRRSAAMGSAVSSGFRECRFVPLSGREGSVTLWMVKRELLVRGALVAGVIACLFGWGAGRRNLWRILAWCLVTALVCLWAPAPLDLPARGAWWGTLVAAAALLAGAWVPRRPAPAALVALVALALAGPLAGDVRGAEDGPPAGVQIPGAQPEPWRVFITPSTTGATALVPEDLFRLLAAGDAGPSAASVRVIRTQLQARRSFSGEPWLLQLDVDADAGGLLVLDQTSAGAVWRTDILPQIDGVAVAPWEGSTRQLLRVVMPAPGRHHIRVAVDPAVTVSGAIETARLAIPPAPQASVEVVEDGADAPLPAAGGPELLICEAAELHSAWVRAQRRGGSERPTYDVDRSERIQLLRAAAGRTPLAGRPTATSRNELRWDEDNCRLTATFDIDPGEAILNSCVVAVDPRLEPVGPADPALALTPLGGHRFRVERHLPLPGRVRMELSFRMPLADPVGVFAVPEVWLEDAGADERTSRLVPAAGLAVRMAYPEGAIPLPARAADIGGGVSVWRTEGGLRTQAWPKEVSGEASGGPPRRVSQARLAQASVERLREPLQGAQSLDLEYGQEQIRVHLQARLDAAVAPVSVIPIQVPRDCEIERISLVEETTAGPDKGAESAVDVRWSRPLPDRLLAVVQRPQTGQFRLDCVALVRGAPAPTGFLPLARVGLAPAAPMIVSWQAAAGLALTVVPHEGTAGPRPILGSLELFADQPGPAYTLAAARPLLENANPPSEPERMLAENDAQGGEPASAAGIDRAGEARVELSETHSALDQRGRLWGVTRFDLLSRDPLVQVKLPPGTRLFDVFVDGRVATDAVPARAARENVWEIRLLDSRWPRAVVVVFAGEIDMAQALGRGTRLEGPAVVGLPCVQTAWTFEYPRGMALEAGRPDEVVAQADLVAIRSAAIDRLESDFRNSIVDCGPDGALRVQDFLARRRREALSPLLSQWRHSMPPDSLAAGGDAPLLCLTLGPNAPVLRVRMRRQADPALVGRLLATAVLGTVAGGLWWLNRCRPAVLAAWLQAGGEWWLVPLLGILLGGWWVTMLLPVWPGGVLLTSGVLSAFVGWRSRRSLKGVAANDHQLIVAPHHADREGTVTQVSPSPMTSVTDIASSPDRA